MLKHINIQIPTKTLKYQGCLEESKLAILAHCAPPPHSGNARKKTFFPLMSSLMNSSLFYYCSQKTKYSCCRNWCTFWQSKTRVFRLTRQMLALTATVLTVLKATTQDQCVLCGCCYLLMLFSWNKMGGKFPPWPTSKCNCIIFTPPCVLYLRNNPPWQQFDKK